MSVNDKTEEPLRPLSKFDIVLKIFRICENLHLPIETGKFVNINSVMMYEEKWWLGMKHLRIKLLLEKVPLRVLKA